MVQSFNKKTLVQLFFFKKKIYGPEQTCVDAWIHCDFKLQLQHQERTRANPGPWSNGAPLRIHMAKNMHGIHSKKKTCMVN